MKIREILGRLASLQVNAEHSAQDAKGDFKELTRDAFLRDAHALKIAIEVLEDQATGAVLYREEIISIPVSPQEFHRTGGAEARPEHTRTESRK